MNVSISHTRQLSILVLFLGSAGIVPGCATGAGEDSEGTSAALGNCIASRDVARFNETYATGFFRFDGVTHATISIARLQDKADDLELALSRLQTQIASLTPGTARYRDAVADRDVTAAKLDTADYMLDYLPNFLNASSKLSKALVSAHDPFANICPEAGCAPGSDPDARFVHHAYRAFRGRDATTAEITAARAFLPDRTSATFNPSSPYTSHVRRFVDSTFTSASIASCQAQLDAILSVPPYEAGPGLPVIYPEIPVFFFRSRIGPMAYGLYRTMLNRYPTAVEGLTIDTLMDGATDCAGAADQLFTRTLGSFEYGRPAATSYRYVFNETPAPATCP